MFKVFYEHASREEGLGANAWKHGEEKQETVGNTQEKEGEREDDHMIAPHEY